MKENHFSEPGQPEFSDSAGSETDRKVDDEALWNLLAHDAQVYPAGKASKNSDWFAARTTALAVQTPQTGTLGREMSYELFLRFFRDARWWIPVPLAGVAAVAFLVLSNAIVFHGPRHTNVLAASSASNSMAPISSIAPISAQASEAEFEQHIELITSSDLIASSDYSQ